MQCKDIPVTPILAFLDGPFDDWPVAGWGTWYWFDDFKPKNSVLHAMPSGTPAKLALAKMRGLIARKLIDGCGCGCRGDFELSSKGRQWLAHERMVRPAVTLPGGAVVEKERMHRAAGY